VWLLQVREYSKDCLDDGAQHSRATEEPRRHQPRVAEAVPDDPGAPPVAAVAAVILQRHLDRTQVVVADGVEGEAVSEAPEERAHLAVVAEQVLHDPVPRQQRHVLGAAQELRHEHHVRRDVAGVGAHRRPVVLLLVRQDVPEDVAGILVDVLQRY